MSRRPAERLATTLAVLAVLGMWLTLQSCGGGPLGVTCSVDTDCASGLQCFKPPMGGSAPGVCTIGCSSGPCTDGSCVQSDFGAVCAASCLASSDCPPGLLCQESPEGPTVCWYEDSHFDKIPDTVRIAKTKLVQDTNKDGELNPGERARLQFFPVNLGQTKVEGLWAELLESVPGVEVVGCSVETPTDWVTCSAACSCEDVTTAAHISLTAGAGSDLPILEITFDLSQESALVDLPFKVRIHDAFGRSWDHNVKVPIVEINSSVMIAAAELTADTNDDGMLSPGEEGSLEIIAQNPGETQVQGLYAELLSTSADVDVLACYAGVGDSWVACDKKCNCKDVGNIAKQTLEPSGVGHVPIYRIDFHLDVTSVATQIQFDVAFNDALDLRWTGSTTVAVVPNEAALSLSHIEIIDDANEDGMVSPMEPASVQIFVKNTGTSKAMGVWAELTGTSENVILDKCSVGIGDSWYPCDLNCSCEDALASSKQILEAGAIGDIAVLRVDFYPYIETTQGEVSFSVTFHDESGGVWPHDFIVDVLPLDASIEIGATALLADDNGDGFLSPGEKVTIEIYPENKGTSNAIGVFARVTDTSPLVDISTCFTFGKQKLWAQCDHQCSCDVVAEEDRQDLLAASLGTEAILQMNFYLDKDAPLEPLWFTVAFEDQFGNLWSDKFWVPVVSNKAKLAVDTVTLWNDTNEDGQLSPGEDVSVQVYAKNIGSTQTFGIWAELYAPAEFVEVSSCYTQAGVIWAKCSAACSCGVVSSNAKQSLEPNEVSTDAILRFKLYLEPDAPLQPLTFNIKFHDELGNEWMDAFYIDVEKHKADISVAFTNLEGDSNGDGKLSPGESASLLVYPRNTGPVKAIDVWAALVAYETEITVNGCFVDAAGAWASCSANCACEGLFDSALQTLEAGKTSDVPILKIDFTLAHDAALKPLDFGLTFYDKLGVTWSDNFSIEVIAPDTTILVGPHELVNDYGSGVEEADSDGNLNPGESATVQIYAQNSGSTTGIGIWGHLESYDEKIEVLSCFVANDLGDWAKCDQKCSCQYVFDAMKHNIPGNTTDSAITLQVNFTLAADALPFPVQFVVGFHDEFANEWFDGFTVPVQVPGG